MFRRLASALVAAAVLASPAFAATNVLQLNYDAAGNITQIQRQLAPGFAITGFSPNSGPPGTAVTIYGTGFSATPAANAVAFNGTTAVVASSEAGSISTTVPEGATTGRLTVTVNGVTATSGSDFVVTVPGAPTIASFSPSSGASGAQVAVTGTNFDAAGTTVKLNGVAASATVSSATDLAFVVPSAASGKITATNGAGTGTSASDFIVPPPGMSLTEIVSSVRVSVGGAHGNIAVGTPGKSGLVLFDAAANTYYSIHLATFETSPTTAIVNYKVVAPDNTVLSSGSVNAKAGSVHTPKTTLAGAYSLVLSPGSATLNTNVRVVASPVLALDGPPVASNLDFQGQSARMVFDAAANQNIGIGLSGVSLSPAGGLASVTISRPDGVRVTASDQTCLGPSSSNTQANCETNLTAPIAGTYSILVEPPSGAMVNAAVQVSSEVTGSLVVDTPMLVSLDRVGQNARLGFPVVAGDRLALDISAMGLQPQPQGMAVLVFAPDGRSLSSCSASSSGGAYCEFGAALTSSGTYSVWISPSYGAYGTFKVTIKRGPAISTTDAPAAFSPANASERARFTFSATAGSILDVAAAGLAINGSTTTTASALLTVYRPDGTVILNGLSCTPAFGGGTCRARLTNINTSGTYSIAIAPPAGSVVSGQLSISDELSASLAAGVAQTLNASRPGQSLRVTFPGTAGDNTSLKLFGLSSPLSSQSVFYNVYKPDGGLYASGPSTTATQATLASYASLPATGTYTAILEPAYGASWQAQFELDPGALIALDGALVTASSAAGEPLRYRVPVNAGQRVEFGLSGLAYAASNTAATTMTLYGSTGQNLVSTSCTTAGVAACETYIVSAPTTGTYTLVLMPPPASAIAAGTFALSTPAAGTFVVNDPAQAVSIARSGQTARYTFSGTAGQLLRINWSGAVVSSGASVAVSVLKPDGSQLSAGSFVNGAASGLDIASLPTTGTYTVVFDPSLAATISASVSLVNR